VPNGKALRRLLAKTNDYLVAERDGVGLSDADRVVCAIARLLLCKYPKEVGMAKIKLEITLCLQGKPQPQFAPLTDPMPIINQAILAMEGAIASDDRLKCLLVAADHPAIGGRDGKPVRDPSKIGFYVSVRTGDGLRTYDPAIHDVWLRLA